MKIVTFLRKNGGLPKRVVDILRERDTFRNKIMAIVEDFDEQSYNNNGKPWKSSRILRVNHLFSFFIVHQFFHFSFVFFFFFSFFVVFIFPFFRSFHFLHFLIFSFFFSFLFFFFFFSGLLEILFFWPQLLQVLLTHFTWKIFFF